MFQRQHIWVHKQTVIMDTRNWTLELFFFIIGVGLTSPGTAATSGLLYSPRWQMRVIVEQLVEWRLAGKPKYSEKTCPSAILSTTNPTWPDPCKNTGRHGGKPVTNRLNYGAANPWIRCSVHGRPKIIKHKEFARQGSNLCGGGVEYLHHDPASHKRRWKGSLKSETVKYGLKSYGTRTQKWLCWRGPAAIVNDRLILSSERAPQINKPATVRQ
jgi:hypothetical protein